MKTLIGQYVQSLRKDAKLRPIDVARQLGLWKDPAKGVRRIETYERTAAGEAGFVAKLHALLGVDPAEIARLVDHERRDHEAWLDEPIARRLTVRMMKMVFVSRPVPAGLLRQQAILWALAKARADGQHSMCLTISRREQLHIRAGGETYWFETIRREQDGPILRIGG